MLWRADPVAVVRRWTTPGAPTDFLVVVGRQGARSPAVSSSRSRSGLSKVLGITTGVPRGRVVDHPGVAARSCRGVGPDPAWRRPGPERVGGGLRRALTPTPTRTDPWLGLLELFNRPNRPTTAWGGWSIVETTATMPEPRRSRVGSYSVNCVLRIESPKDRVRPA